MAAPLAPGPSAELTMAVTPAQSVGNLERFLERATKKGKP